MGSLDCDSEDLKVGSLSFWAVFLHQSFSLCTSLCPGEVGPPRGEGSSLLSESLANSLGQVATGSLVAWAPHP